MAAGRRTVAGFWRDAAVRSSGHSVGDPYGRGLLVFYGFSGWHLGANYCYPGENLVGGRDLRCGALLRNMADLALVGSEDFGVEGRLVSNAESETASGSEFLDFDFFEAEWGERGAFERAEAVDGFFGEHNTERIADLADFWLQHGFLPLL